MSFSTLDEPGHGWDHLHQSIAARDYAALAAYAAIFSGIIMCGAVSCCAIIGCCSTANEFIRKGFRATGRAIGAVWALVRWLLHALTCWAFARKRREKKYGDRPLCVFDDCAQLRVTTTSFAGEAFQSPYCARHHKRHERKHAAIVRQYEVAGSKYKLNSHYFFSDVDVCKLAQKEAEQAKQRSIKFPPSHSKQNRPGFIYIYRSSVDEKAVPYDWRDTRCPTMWKIGMTTQASAAERVAEQDDTIFVDVENNGWWSTGDASAISTEQVIHAFLANQRMRRFNTETDAFEIEWFFVSYADAASVIRSVVALNGQWENLKSCEAYALTGE